MRTGYDPNAGVDCMLGQVLEVHIVLKDCVCADTMLSSPTKSNRQQDLPPAGVVQGNCSFGWSAVKHNAILCSRSYRAPYSLLCIVKYSACSKGMLPVIFWGVMLSPV